MPKRRPKPYLHVYGHPRSGNNLLMALLAENFYPGQDLSTPPGRIGHWSDRRLGAQNPHGMLGGHHHFRDDPKYPVLTPTIYIFRDGRAVAASLWKTKAFLHPTWRGWSFRKFLRTHLDWTGSPGRNRGWLGPIPHHWRMHVESWKEREGPDLLLVRYEEVVKQPQAVLQHIAEWAGLSLPREIARIDQLVGWFPNEGRIDAWRDVFTKADFDYFHTLVPMNHWALFEGAKGL